MNDDKTLIQIRDKYEKKLLTLTDVTSKEFTETMNIIKWANAELRQNEKLRASKERDEARAKMEEKESEHKMDLEAKELAHKIELDDKEFEHKQVMEQQDFELREKENDSRARMAEAEFEFKKQEAQDGKKFELGKLGVAGAIEAILLGALCNFEAKGYMFPFQKWGFGRKGRIN